MAISRGGVYGTPGSGASFLYDALGKVAESTEKRRNERLAVVAAQAEPLIQQFGWEGARARNPEAVDLYTRMLRLQGTGGQPFGSRQAPSPDQMAASLYEQYARGMVMNPAIRGIPGQPAAGQPAAPQVTPMADGSGQPGSVDPTNSPMVLRPTGPVGPAMDPVAGGGGPTVDPNAPTGAVTPTREPVTIEPRVSREYDPATGLDLSADQARTTERIQNVAGAIVNAARGGNTPSTGLTFFPSNYGQLSPAEQAAIAFAIKANIEAIPNLPNKNDHPSYSRALHETYRLSALVGPEMDPQNDPARMVQPATASPVTATRAANVATQEAARMEAALRARSTGLQAANTPPVQMNGRNEAVPAGRITIMPGPTGTATLENNLSIANEQRQAEIRANLARSAQGDGSAFAVQRRVSPETPMASELREARPNEETQEALIGRIRAQRAEQAERDSAMLREAVILNEKQAELAGRQAAALVTSAQPRVSRIQGAVDALAQMDTTQARGRGRAAQLVNRTTKDLTEITRTLIAATPLDEDMLLERLGRLEATYRDQPELFGVLFPQQMQQRLERSASMSETAQRNAQAAVYGEQAAALKRTNEIIRAALFTDEAFGRANRAQLDRVVQGVVAGLEQPEPQNQLARAQAAYYEQQISYMAAQAAAAAAAEENAGKGINVDFVEALVKAVEAISGIEGLRQDDYLNNLRPFLTTLTDAIKNPQEYTVERRGWGPMGMFVPGGMVPVPAGSGLGGPAPVSPAADAYMAR